ncbi:hypothetical protein [Chryseobacterium pennipullorum]|uniref:Uncharacterized protein n=1 Tax=Chryseobacterium pennipullorum TaxID=2258963 RepID=A0A3D9B1Q5_9FLAO|nr:hypothetical protein [Chryseobacterium pennipullorum]REC47258.1 hypothetical protein DRF67_11600 [Chryseobacterium pennipullorum]
MTKKKFILYSILKTWLISTVTSVVFVILYLSVTREDREVSRNCDMSGLAYGFVIFWVLILSLVSFTSLLALLKPFRSTVKTAICWFILPLITCISSFFLVVDSQIGKEEIIMLFIMNLPWMVLWSYYYTRLTSRFRGS